MASKKDLLTFEHRGLRKVISGGQCGVDYGALLVAQAFEIETGGTVPRGWRTHFGPKPDLAKFGMVEHFRPEYPPRTECNVVNSDGTLIIASNFNSPGVTLTRNLCAKHKKPFLCYDIRDLRISQIINFIISSNVEVMNVAGNRDKILGNSFHEEMTFSILSKVFVFLDQDKRLIRQQ